VLELQVIDLTYHHLIFTYIMDALKTEKVWLFHHDLDVEARGLEPLNDSVTFLNLLKFESQEM